MTTMAETARRVTAGADTHRDQHVVAALDAITQQPMDVTHAPAREGEIRDSFGDPAALTAALDWTPEITLEEGLRDLLEQL